MNPIGQLALICLGSNDTSIIGDAMQTVQKAMSILAELSIGQVAQSKLYQTPAFPVGAGPDYVNAAMAIQTDLAADALLTELHRIEALAGRERVQRWGQRTLDLDLIAMDDLICPNREVFAHWQTLPAAAQQVDAPDELILPHPRMQDRSFALVPLCDIAPDWVHPIMRETVKELLAKRPHEERESVVLLT